ncbi:hypothetical protein ACFWY5_12085 [Nonomuraea sp. NPDC059007]|uniref:hypothetical protein n=1 Tax=Nonomuraea sp. NPDC059007 TaxID=3346692 RepID=UPI003698BF1C
MRTVLVVVTLMLGQDLSQAPLPLNQKVIEAFAPGRVMNRSANAFARDERGEILRTRMSAPGEHIVKSSAELATILSGSASSSWQMRRRLAREAASDLQRGTMACSTHLYDLLATHWAGVHNGSFSAVWSENLDVEETALKVGADLTTATQVTLANLPEGFEGDQMPGDYDGIVLIGQFGAWSLAFQVQWSNIVDPSVLAALSQDGRAVGLSWNANGSAYRFHYTMRDHAAQSHSMHTIPTALALFAVGLRMPDEDEWDLPADQASPREEMITVGLALMGRITGRELDQEWLNTPHTRYLIRASR